MSAEHAAPLFWTPILYDVAHVLESVEGPEVRIDRILELMGRFVPYDRCALLEVAPVLGRAISIAPLDTPAEERAALASRLGGMLALLTERPLEEVRQTRFPRVEGRAHLAVPIIGLGETTGIVFVDRAAPPNFEESHLAFLSVIAAQIGAYLTAVRADRELRASEGRFRRVYEAGMIGIAFMDGDGRINEANETFASLVARPRAELQAGELSWRSMTPAEHRGRDDEALREAIERGACAPYEKLFVREDGQRVTALAGAARLDGGSLVAFVLDVSDRERIATERAGLLRERESDLAFLQMFMGMLGHDLRNPLGAIRMSAQYLSRVVEDELAVATARIVTSTDRIDRMVEQLLDLTRIRLAGGMPVERSRVDLGDLCRGVIEELRAAYPDAAVHLEVTGDVTGDWDGDRLLQAASNLVGNAIQHSAGRPEVALRVSGADEAVALAVHNPGAIPAELMPLLFQPFRGTQVGGARKGLGLGLYITKHIIEAHAGAIEVASSERAGTSFSVRLPRRAPP
jgi:PAS domain S-box-containing protein